MIFSRRITSFAVLYIFMMSAVSGVNGADGRFSQHFNCFKNFINCEFTRSDAVDYFKGEPHKIVMINFFDAVNEGDILIVTGAVKFWVKDRHETLFVALGIKTLFGHDKVSYFVARKTDFSIMATELINYPYKERCAWSQYWIDLDS